MIYLFSGDQTYFINQNLKKLKARIPDQNFDFNYHEINCLKEDYKRLEIELKTPPFLSDKRFLILWDLLEAASKWQKEAEALQLLQTKNDDTIVVIIEAKLDRRKKISKELIKISQHKHYESLDQAQAIAWVKKQFQQHSISLPPNGANHLVNRVGVDTWILSQEIKKLVTYSDTQKISIQDIDELTVAQSQENVFGFTDALANQRVDQALQTLYQNLRSGVHPLQLLRLITNHFRKILFCADCLAHQKNGQQALVKELKVHPFAAKKITAQARKMSLSQALQSYENLANIDRYIKYGQLEATLALELFCLQAVPSNFSYPRLNKRVPFTL